MSARAATLRRVPKRTTGELARLRHENAALRRSVTELERREIVRSLSPRDRILRAATQLFSQQGYARTTTRQVARDAAVSLATIAQHFRDKEGLYSAVVAALRSLEVAEITRLRHEGRKQGYRPLSYVERFRVIFPQWVAFHFDHPEICRIELHRLVDCEPSAGQILLPANQDSIRQFTELVGQPRSVEDLRRVFLVANDLILTFVGGAQYHALVLGLDPNSPEYRDVAVATVVEACINL